MTEAEEIADTLPRLPQTATMDDARKVVRSNVPDAGDVMTDNIAWALWWRSREET